MSKRNTEQMLTTKSGKRLPMYSAAEIPCSIDKAGVPFSVKYGAEISRLFAREFVIGPATACWSIAHGIANAIKHQSITNRSYVCTDYVRVAVYLSRRCTLLSIRSHAGLAFPFYR